MSEALRASGRLDALKNEGRHICLDLKDPAHFDPNTFDLLARQFGSFYITEKYHEDGSPGGSSMSNKLDTQALRDPQKQVYLYSDLKYVVIEDRMYVFNAGTVHNKFCNAAHLQTANVRAAGYLKIIGKVIAEEDHIRFIRTTDRLMYGQSNSLSIDAELSNSFQTNEIANGPFGNFFALKE